MSTLTPTVPQWGKSLISHNEIYFDHVFVIGCLALLVSSLIPLQIYFLNKLLVLQSFSYSLRSGQPRLLLTKEGMKEKKNERKEGRKEEGRERQNNFFFK